MSCQWCQGEMPTRTWARRTKFCSDPCQRHADNQRQKLKKRTQPHHCAYCNTLLDEAKRAPNQRYCNLDCRKKAQHGVRGDGFADIPDERIELLFARAKAKLRLKRLLEN